MPASTTLSISPIRWRDQTADAADRRSASRSGGRDDAPWKRKNRPPQSAEAKAKATPKAGAQDKGKGKKGKGKGRRRKAKGKGKGKKAGATS